MDYQAIVKAKLKQTINVETKPIFFNLNNEPDKISFEALISSGKPIEIYDTITDQLKEFIKCSNPSTPLKETDFETHITALVGSEPLINYGIWVYYPWSYKLVHLLNKEAFIDVRTNRNQHKITRKERNLLGQKKVGVIGLSVGQSVALALAMERGCGELRLADFDTLELSNYNRIRTGLQHLGLPKVVIAAREIAEIDPFINVICYPNGITEDNIDDFLLLNGKLDLLIEECDGLDVKILSRQKAKEYQIPVVMETNDRGMIDIERFDLTPNYPILHGLIGDTKYEQLKGLTTEQKIPFILKLIGVNTLSLRSKVSLVELGQSLSTWPQLASSVIIGGGLVADISRRILLGQLNQSGRFYFDTEDIIKNDFISKPAYMPENILSISLDDMRKQIESIVNANENIAVPDIETIKKIIADAGTAPSSGNDQPWKWLFKHGQLFLFHEVSRSYSFGDYKHMATYISMGAMLENLVLSAHRVNWEVKIELFPIKANTVCVAKVLFQQQKDAFTEIHVADDLVNVIYKRCTNRHITSSKPINQLAIESLKNIAETVEGAQVKFITDADNLKNIGQIISAVDRIRIMHPQGHYDFFYREMRWSNEQAVATKTGMDIQTLEIPQQALAALRILSDNNVMEVLRDIDGAKAFKNISVQNTINSAAVGLLTMPTFSPTNFINGGRASQRQWLLATELNIAYQPMIAPLYLFPRVVYGQGEGLNKQTVQELQELREMFLQIFPGENERGEVFLFRIFEGTEVKKRSLRLPLDEILFTD